MSNLFGNLVLNVVLLGGVFGCLYRVDPFLAYAAAIYTARELHAIVVERHVAAAMKKD